MPYRIAALLGIMALASPAMAAPYQPHFTILYTLNGGADGAPPNGPLVSDDTGNLYGTAEYGGVSCPDDPSGGCGTIFQLSRNGQYTVLHSFTSTPDAANVRMGLTIAHGRIYGSSYNGGTYGVGTIFSMKMDGSDYRIDHNFAPDTGGTPQLQYPLIPGPGDGLIGLGHSGGTYNKGFIYLWEPKDTVINLYYFTGKADGAYPNSIIRDSAGNLFGTTSRGGSCSLGRQGCGVVYEINATTRSLQVLHTFTGGADGYQPLLGSVDAKGNLYGISVPGKKVDGEGQLFTLSPSAAGYQFTLGKPVYSGVPYDVPVSGPQLTQQGILAGANSASLYFVIAGHVYTYPLPGTGAVGPLTIEPNGTIYGAGLTGDYNQTGNIYSFTLTK